MENKFEKLRPSDYVGKSDPDWDYNCIAWAMGRKDSPWWPSTLTGYHWPRNLPREDVGQETLPNFINAFKRLRYKVLRQKNYSLQNGFEKVAIYAKGRQNPTHAARQLPSGVWTSKIGDEEDIEHVSPTVLEGREYGMVAVVMKRPVKSFRGPQP
jgi:hypothetical protein